MLVSVRLYIQGDGLQPSAITELLGVQPSRSHARGDSRILSGGRTATEKIGLWVWKTSLDAVDAPLSSCMAIFQKTFGHLSMPLVDLPNAESLWIDVHVVEEIAADKDDAEVSFVLTPQDVGAMNAIGLPVEFTVSFDLALRIRIP